MLKDTLQTKYEKKKISSRTLKESYNKRLLLNERQELLVAEHYARLILEEIDKDELAKTSQVLQKLNAISKVAKGIPQITSAIQSASSDVNEFTGGGMKALAKKGLSAIQRKFGAKAGENPLLKSISLLNSLESGLAAIPTLVKNNFPDFDPAGEPLEKQAGSDKKKITNLQKSIAKAFRPSGLFGKISSLFGKGGGMPYVTDAAGIAKSIMSMPASEIEGLAAAASSGPSASDLTATVKDMAASSRQGQGSSGDEGKISSEKDLAQAIAAKTAGNDQEKAEKASAEADKNPRKFTQKFLDSIAKASKQDPDVVSKVVTVLIKSGKMRSSISESLNTRNNQVQLTSRDAREAMRLYLESGGSSRKWVQLLIERNAQKDANAAADEFAKTLDDVKDPKDFEEKYKNFLQQMLDDKKLDSETMSGLKGAWGKYKSRLSKATGGSSKTLREMEKKFASTNANFEKQTKEADKASEQGKDASAEEPSKKKTFEFKFSFDAIKKFLQDEISTEYEEANKPADEIGEEEIKQKSIELIKTIKQFQSFAKENNSDIAEVATAYVEQNLSDIVSAVKEGINLEVDAQKMEKDDFERVVGDLKEAVYQWLKKHPGDDIPESPEDIFELAEKSIPNVDSIPDLADKYGIDLGDIAKEFAASFKKEIIEAVTEVIEIYKKDRKEELESEMDPKKILKILKDQDKNIDFTKTTGKKIAVDLLKTQYELSTKEALKYIEEKLLPLVGGEKKQSPMERLSPKINAAQSIEDLIGILSKVDPSLNLGADKSGNDITLGSQVEIIKNAAKDPKKSKKLIDTLSSEGGIKEKVSSLLSGKDKAKGPHAELADEIAKQLKDVPPDAIAAVLAAIPDWLMAESKRKRDNLLLGFRPRLKA